jgi:hypothetical protein
MEELKVAWKTIWIEVKKPQTIYITNHPLKIDE